MGRIEKTIEVNTPVSQCYEMWTRFPEFPRFMKHVESITSVGMGNRNWHWKVHGPLGKSVEWDATVDAMEPNKLVSWHSVHDSEVDNAGAVTFESLGPNLTRIHLAMTYNPPAGALGELVADIFQNPSKMAEEDLTNFKELAEASPQLATAGVNSAY